MNHEQTHTAKADARDHRTASRPAYRAAKATAYASALIALAACTRADVPGLDDRDWVFMNPLCVLICVPVLTLADTDTGSGTSNVSQTASPSVAPAAAGSYSK